MCLGINSSSDGKKNDETKCSRGNCFGAALPSPRPLSKRLVSKGLEVTIVIFSGTNKSSTVAVGPVKLESVSDYLEADNVMENSVDAYLERFKAVVTLRLPQIIAKLGISCLVYDSIIPWALDIAKQLGLPGAVFFTQSCTINTIFYNVHEGLLKLPLEDPLSSIVGQPLLLEQRDLPSFVYDIGAYPVLVKLLVNQFSNFWEADWVLVNTFTSLEEEVVNWMASLRQILTIGPTIPSKYLDKRLEEDKGYGVHLFKPEINVCIDWLNSKETSSVVYVSFGSLAALGEDQLRELALGLNRSNSFFLWVIRETEQKKLPANFLEEISERGLVVSWSPQLEVLAHKAVGCFMTHCGWNSTLEALSLGVPMVAVPQWTDQTTNAKFVEGAWQVGMRAKMDAKGIITKEEVERCIREIMEGEKSKDIKQISEKWKKLAIDVVDEGGTPDKNINEFVAKLVCK